MHAHSQRIRQSWRWVYVLPISRSLRLYLTCDSVSEIRPRPAADSKAHHPQNPPRTHTSFEHEERVCEVGGSTGVAQLGFSWPRLWLSLSQSQLAWSIWAGRATDQRAGLDEWMEQASFPEPVSAEGQAKHPDSCGVGVASSQLGPHLPDCRASSAKRPPKSCQDPWRLA